MEKIASIASPSIRLTCRPWKPCAKELHGHDDFGVRPGCGRRQHHRRNGDRCSDPVTERKRRTLRCPSGGAFSVLWHSHPPNLPPSSSKTHLSSSACSNVALASTLALVPPYQAGCLWCGARGARSGRQSHG